MNHQTEALLRFMGPEFRVVSALEVARFVFPDDPGWERKIDDPDDDSYQRMMSNAMHYVDARSQMYFEYGARCKTLQRVIRQVEHYRWSITRIGQLVIGADNESDADVEYQHYVQVVCDQLLESHDDLGALGVLRSWGINSAHSSSPAEAAEETALMIVSAITESGALERFNRVKFADILLDCSIMLRVSRHREPAYMMMHEVNDELFNKKQLLSPDTQDFLRRAISMVSPRET